MSHFTEINKNFIIALLLIFFNAGGGMLTILGTLFLNDLKFTVETIGVIMGAFGIGSFIGGYLGGHISDYISVKKIVSYSLLGNATFTMIFAGLNSAIMFGSCMFFIGLFNSSFRPAAMLLLFATKGKLSDITVLSFRRVVVNFGFSIGAGAFGFLYSYSNRLSFLIIGGLFFFVFLCSFLINTSSLLTKTKHEAGKLSRGHLLIFISINVLIVITLAILDQHKTTYTLFLKDFSALSIIDISILFSFAGVLVIILQVPVGMLFDKIPIAIGCFVGSVFLGLGFGMTSFIDSFFLAFVSVTLWVLGEIILMPLQLSFILKLNAGKKGRVMGIYQASFSIGMFLSPIVGGFIYQQFSPQTLWNLCFFVSIICGIIFLTVGKFYKKTNLSI